MKTSRKQTSSEAAAKEETLKQKDGRKKSKKAVVRKFAECGLSDGKPLERLQEEHRKKNWVCKMNKTLAQLK